LVPVAFVEVLLPDLLAAVGVYWFSLGPVLLRLCSVFLENIGSSDGRLLARFV
jgi:hypothetical protein